MSADGCILPDSKAATLKKCSTSICLSVRCPGDHYLGASAERQRSWSGVYTLNYCVFVSAEAQGSLALCEVPLNERLLHTHAAVLAKLCASACVLFFPLLLVKGVGKTRQKHLLEMTASGEAAPLRIETKRDGCTFGSFLKRVDSKWEGVKESPAT